jgi:hypothetical protein
LKLSIRTKILGGYSLVIILFFAAVINNLITQNRIGKRLSVVNDDYLPKMAVLNTMANYSHLDDGFDFEKIKEIKDNTLLKQTIRLYHPRLLDNKLKEIKDSFLDSLKNSKSLG